MKTPVATEISSRIQKAAAILMAEGPVGLYSRIKSRWGREGANRRLESIGLSDLSNAAKFEVIYRERLWVRAIPKSFNRDGSVSGHGSTEQSTRVFRSQLQRFLEDHSANAFLDAPCGDFNWMKLVNVRQMREYIGGDIVRELIERLNAEYALPRPSVGGLSRRFILLDVTRDSLPKADVWLCKDCLQHMSNEDILSVLRNARVSPIQYFLFSNHAGVETNKDIKTGQFRPVDLTLAPFNLPTPFAKLQDAPTDGEARYVGVWRKQDLLSV